jgi:hypothetical protein
MKALRNQAPRLKGDNSRLRNLQGVLRVLNGLKMPQGAWVRELWKKSQNRNHNKGRERASDLSEGREGVGGGGGEGEGG